MAFDLKIELKELRSDRGHVLYLLFDHARGFPDQPERSFQQGSLKTDKAQSGFVIKDIPAGHYALSIIHDENSNNKLDTNILGIPKEGFGFSQNPKIFFGAPSFQKCEFKVESDVEINIRMKHF
jgi:uncharacterized protein (DUF2141 family)